MELHGLDIENLGPNPHRECGHTEIVRELLEQA